MRRLTFFLLAFFLLPACGPRGGKTVPAPAARPFPAVEVPGIYTDPGERTRFAILHFWDAFTDTAATWPCDSVTVNGVPSGKLEEQMGLWATLLDRLPLEDGAAATARLYDRLDAFERHDTASTVFEEMVRLTTKYLYDANSPCRNEDLYLPFVSRLGRSDLVEKGLRAGYEWDARMCALNRVGTPAADFSFTDTRGRVRTLYGIKAEYTVLIFGNPGCEACREMTEAMAASETVASLLREGRLQVVDVYIDREIEDWKAHADSYPAAWINGYDHNYAIRRDMNYHVRAIPSMYLLSREKSVLLKDAPQEKILRMLEAATR